MTLETQTLLFAFHMAAFLILDTQKQLHYQALLQLFRAILITTQTIV